MITERKTPVRLTSLLALIFFFSGFASLIYEVVWQRLLTLYYGVGAISTTLIVSVYMLGLGVGALFGGFLAERVRDKITLYFVVELLIGFFGLVSLPFLDFLGRHTAGSSYLVSAPYMFLFLCLPTMLMGITLPLLTKIFNRLIQNFLNTVSFLYFINTIGAAVGTIFASYVIISFFGLDSGIYFAVAINFILAALIFLARYFPIGQQDKEFLPELEEERNDIFGNIAYPLVFITGFLAIGYEIVWFRVIGVLVKDSPYAFSTTLSVYLLGIALGSLAMNKYLRRQKTIGRSSLFFSLQFLIGICVLVIFIGYFYLTKYTFLDKFTIMSSGTSPHPIFISFPLSIKGVLTTLYYLFDVFLWPMIFVFVPTILMGASFPLIASLALSQRNKEGKTVANVYFFNITGNVLGGILTGFLLLPHLGTEVTLLVFSSVGIFLGLFVKRFAGRQLATIWRIGLVLILLVVNVTFFPKAGQLYPIMLPSHGKEFAIYLEEGADATVVTYQYQDEVWNYINGQSHGGRPGYRYYYDTIEAASFAPRIRNVLIIGYGCGSTTETILKMEDVQKVTIVELSNTLMNNLKRMPIFQKMLADSRLDLIIDDGRRFLLRTDEKFDLILMDAVRTTTSYSNNLYSSQFFELIAQHLNSGGVLMVWMDEGRVVPKTVLSVFDQVRMYNYFCLASNTPFKRNDERQINLLDSFSPQERDPISKQGEYLGDQAYIEKITQRYPINQDWKPVAEYYLGLRVKERLFLRE